MGEEGRKSRMVVAAMDESEHSMYALKWALETLACRGDKFVLLHAKRPLSTSAGFGEAGFIITSDVLLSIEKSEEKSLNNLMSVAKKLCDEKQVSAEIMFLHGDPRDVICEALEKLNADYLVMGSRGFGAMKRAFLGSVSDYCSHHAKCPVVIVKLPPKSS